MPFIKEYSPTFKAMSPRQLSAFPACPILSPRPAVSVRRCHRVPLGAVRRPLLIEPCAPFIFAASDELEVSRIDAGGEPAGVIRLAPGRDRAAVADLPGDIMAAADVLPEA
jgi:hypothetical protein